MLSALSGAALPFFGFFECFFGTEMGEDCGDFDSWIGMYVEYFRLSIVVLASVGNLRRRRTHWPLK